MVGFYFFRVSKLFSLGLGFLTRISASRRVSDFTIRHPLIGFSQKLSNVKEVPDITINYEIPV